MRMTCLIACALIISSTALGHQAQNVSRMRRPAMNEGGQGVIIGYVYWDGNLIKHQPPADCSGLSVTVDWGNSSSGALASNLTYLPNVGADGVCAYAVHGVPVGQNLQVQANVTASAAFYPAALAGGGNKSIKIMGGNELCNNLPPAVPSSSTLSANWWTCPNYAYNVNFVLVPARELLPRNSTRIPPQGPGPGMQSRGTLLASGSQKTLLEQKANAPSTNAAGAPTPNGGSQQGGITTASGALTLSGGPQPAATATGGALTLSGGPQPAATTTGGALTLNGGPQPSATTTGGAIQLSGGTQQDGTTATPRSNQTARLQQNAGSPLAVVRPAIGTREGPNLYVAQACANDPSFRILLVTGASDGKTLTVGPQYTIWGCSFGNMPAVKRPAPPVTSPSQNQTASYPSNYNVAVWTSQPFIAIDARTVSWSDNAIVVTFVPRPANHPGPSTANVVLLSQLLVTRGDGQTRIFGSEGGLYFRLTN